MAQPSLAATFFCAPDGTIVLKAKPVGEALRGKIYRRDGGVCKECSSPVSRFGNTNSPFQTKPPAAVDHIFPRARGGQNNEENLRLLCISCNASKGAK